jgi:transcriptional regulator GlxA family with amidase domain
MGAFRQAIIRPNSDAVPANPETASSGAASGSDLSLSTLIAAVTDNRVRKILEIIEAHPGCKLQHLAVRCNLSESRLQHLFKQGTGIGLGRLIAEQRLLQAADFLLRTNMSIKEIASALGYGHASSFTRAFERRFQQAPRCYRVAQSPNPAP